MTELAHQTIAALRAGHDDLVGRVATMSAEDLAQTSGASEWDVAQVLSHLGSGAEIGLGTLRSQLDPTGSTPEPDNEAVWDRWNAMSAQARAQGFVASDEALVSAYESLSDDQLRNVRIDLRYLPEPIPIAELAGMRLNEQTLHGWDVVVASEPAATLAADALPVLVDRSDVFLGYIAKAGALAERPVTITVTTTDPSRTFGLFIADEVSLGDAPAAPDVTLDLPAEAWLRLVAGRLAPDHTPPGVEISGAVTLDDLRPVFPGY